MTETITLPALTVWAPWASLIIAGAKPIEWRGHPAPRVFRHRRIAIHCGARPAKDTEIQDILARIADKESSLVAEIAEPILRNTHRLSYPLSSILGTAVLGEPIPVRDWLALNAPGYDSNRIDFRKWAWPLTDIVRFDIPIPYRGAQGFWRARVPAP